MNSSNNEDHLRKLQSESKAERNLILEMDRRVTSAHLKRELQTASYSLDDLDDLFLSSAARESRSPEALSRWLSYADFVLERAILKRKEIQDTIAKFGHDAVAAG